MTAPTRTKTIADEYLQLAMGVAGSEHCIMTSEEYLSGLPAGSLEPALRASIEMAEAKRRAQDLPAPFGGYPMTDEQLALSLRDEQDAREQRRNYKQAKALTLRNLATISDARRAALAETIRLRCAESMEPIATAIIGPSVARDYLTGAIRSLQAAYEAACELDPKDAA